MENKQEGELRKIMVFAIIFVCIIVAVIGNFLEDTLGQIAISSIVIATGATLINAFVIESELFNFIRIACLTVAILLIVIRIVLKIFGK